MGANQQTDWRNGKKKKKSTTLYTAFTTLVKLIPKHFIVFDSFVKGNIFLIFLLHCSWLVYKKLN